MIYTILSHDAPAIWPEVSDYVTRALKLTIGQINADSVLERTKPSPPASCLTTSSDIPMTFRLSIIEPKFVDFAWKDGASCLAEACALVDEITGDQLKMVLARGERYLVRMDDETGTVGWGAFRVDQLPNLRVLHATDLVAHNGHFEQFFAQLKAIAASLGCSRIRCSAHDAQARLYRQKLGFKPVYTTLEIEVTP